MSAESLNIVKNGFSGSNNSYRSLIFFITIISPKSFIWRCLHYHIFPPCLSLFQFQTKTSSQHYFVGYLDNCAICHCWNFGYFLQYKNSRNGFWYNFSRCSHCHTSDILVKIRHHKGNFSLILSKV